MTIVMHRSIHHRINHSGKTFFYINRLSLHKASDIFPLAHGLLEWIG